MEDDKRLVWIASAAALVEGYLAILPPLTRALLWIMVADIILRVLADAKEKKLSVATVFEVATKAVAILILIGVTVVLNPHVQPVMGIDLVLSSSFFYMVFVLTSVTRSAAILNVPVFNQAQDVLRYFNLASGGKNSDSTGDKKP